MHHFAVMHVINLFPNERLSWALPGSIRLRLMHLLAQSKEICLYELVAGGRHPGAPYLVGWRSQRAV